MMDAEMKYVIIKTAMAYRVKKPMEMLDRVNG